MNNDITIGSLVSLERLRKEFKKETINSDIYEKAAIFLSRVGSIAMRNQGQIFTN